MNRPRNRQSRPARASNDSSRGGSGRGARAPGPLGNSITVPSIQQVVPGAAVSIVLKQDQPTGREVQGVVQDLLTRGNHPRGIKVRLQDGRVGRVQRILGNDTVRPSPSPQQSATSTTGRIIRMERDARLDEADYPSGPPPRTLAAFFPETESEDETPSTDPDHPAFSSASAKCPICGIFEGDEVAVSRHVEEHLT